MFDYFDRVYCIHLPNPARRTAIEAQFARVGIRSVQYIHAKQPMGGLKMSNMRRSASGEFGANLSHIEAVVQAIADGAERPLFLEDDIEFRDNAVQVLTAALAELPVDWDVLYMGGHPREPAQWAGRSLVKVGTFSFAESYSLSRKSLLAFYDYWSDRIGQLKPMYDFVLGEFAALHKGYCVYPLLTHQPPGFSQIASAHDDKTLLVDRGWKLNLSTR